MALQFIPMGAEHLDAVRSFNERMRKGNAPFLLPDSLEGSADGPIQRTPYLALDRGDVHGGVIELDHPAWLAGSPARTFIFQSPLSEGILDRRYAMVAMRMVKFIEARGEAVCMVGMGAETNAFPRVLKASGWSVRPIPFLFRVHRVRAFFRELEMLNTTRARRIASRAAAFTGIGSLGLTCAQLRRSRLKFRVRRESTWGDWTDEIWKQCRDNCSFAVARERALLQALYPSNDPNLSILLMEAEGNPVGWAACLDTRIKDGRYFGNMRVGCVLDCVARPEAMTSTAIAADQELATRGADLVFLNHSHAAWVRAFRSAGFLSGPSNYLVGASKALTRAVRSAPGGEDSVHITRGDSDGRVSFA